MRTSTITSSIITAIGSAIGGLVWVFGLYNLENETGKKILIAAYISMIVTAIAVAISTIMFYEEFINSAVFQELIDSDSYSSSTSSTQVFSSLQYLGNTLIIGAIGGVVSNILIFIALYIPYNRIKSGELVPSLSTHLKRCSNCGREAQPGYTICAYCGNKFESVSVGQGSTRRCDNCGSESRSDYLVCPYCGKSFGGYP
jgi:hypothetical protein